ncbi:MAG: ATP-binding protein [Dehalococcoidia bacterium]|nr:ATP-binding protein [Dehalococcoidia bacterium]
MAKVKIHGNLGVLLTYLGELYGRPDNAVKEYISNALDEWIKAREKGEIEGPCEVTYCLEKERITIDYVSPGMDEQEFREALNKVGDSVKRESTVRQIGKLGIGIFAFNQVGSTCAFYSKKAKGTPTIKVVLRSNSDEAQIDVATKRESRRDPGMTIVISRLKQDPTRSRGPLAPASLQRFFAEQFDSDLREGNLEVTINCAARSYQVKPPAIDLPKVGEAFGEVCLSTDWQKKFHCQFWFDRSGKSHVSIRHMGVSIIRDLKTHPAYGLEESSYASGALKGYIGADFLKPLPARTSFEENDDWVQFLVELDRILPSLEAEIDELRREEEEKRLTEVQKRAIELARDILKGEEFEDLELLEGLGRKPPEPRFPPNGFDFVPSSMRITPAETGALPLKAFVPRTVPDNSLVELSTSDASAVDLRTPNPFLRACEADTNGIVTVRVFLTGRTTCTTPVILTARTGKLKAEAHIRVAQPEQTRQPVVGVEKQGRGISYTEGPFEDGPRRHSEFVAGQVRVNELNPDYRREVKEGSDRQNLAYIALMIGKEAIAYNDKSGTADYFLEKLLTYTFRVRAKTTRGRRE